MKNASLARALCALVALFALALPARADFSCALTFPSAPQTALANFPVLVRLAEGAPTGFSYVDCPTGGCLWFTDANNDPIPCDVDTWDTTGTSLVWVSVPSLSDVATITMHWDATGAPAGLPASSAVWSRADYVGVWHMNEILEDGSGNHYTPDASASSWDAYKANEADAYPVTISDAGNATTVPPTGHAMVNQLGDSQRKTGGFIVPAASTSSTTIGANGFTVSFFEECTTTGNDRAVAFGTAYNDLGCMTAAANKTYVMNGANFKDFDYNDGLANNAWRHIAGVYASVPVGYVGGVSRTLGQSNWNVTKTLSKGIGLGTFTTQGETFTGYLDEIRIRNVASTSEWIAEENKTVTTANYVSFGTVDTGVEVLRLGAVAVSNVTPTNAVVAGELRTLGEGAVSADVWLVYTDGATTNAVSLGTKSAAPAALSATLENLAAATSYACWFTATNSLFAGADSPAATFRTKRIVAGTGFLCELTFPSAPATPLANFPVLVRISEAGIEGFFYEHCPAAANLWFTDANGDALPFEVDTWNASGESLVWVSVPSFSSSTTITMHWAPNAVYAEDSPPSREVWTRANYNAVWHFSGSNAESVTNLVPASTRGQPTYDGNLSLPGPVGKTLWLDGSSDLRYAPDPAWTAIGDGSALSVSFLVRSSSGGFARMISCMSDWNKPAGYEFTFQNSNTKITVGSSNGSQAQTDISTGPGSKWKHFAGTWSGTTVKFYDDGSKAKEATLNAVVAPTEALTFGAQGGSNTGAPLTGGLDEIRIRRETSSDDWVAAEYATATDADYVSFGEVESDGVTGAALELGALLVSSVSATGASVSARLKGLGENATSANLWLVVTGFGQTRTYPLDPATEPKVVVAALSGLQPGASWTAYLTATNNAVPAVGADSAPAAFTTLSDAGSGSPGLYQAVTTANATAADAAANWDIAASGVVTLGPLAMRSSGNNHDYWASVDGTSFTWSNNIGFGYAGYMYMEGGKDYWFGASADDAGYVWVDNGDANWNAKRTATQFPGYGKWQAVGPFAIAETGYYRVVFANWNNSGGAGAEPTASVLYPQLRYIALESGASTPTAGDAGWQEAVDPGDGSLFLSEAPTRAVSVLSAVRDGTLLSARVAVGEAFPGEASDLRYVYGATNGGSDPADWEGGSLVASSLPTTAVTNDYLVAIAADTRYVRFYTQDGDAVTWSATVSLDWAGETTIADAFLFLGDPDASAVSGDAATLSAVLNAPGDGATAAQAWFVLSGGGVTRTIPAGTATVRTNLTVAVTGLAPETAYTFYATATNNAATSVGVDSAVATFTTGAGASAWNTARATFTPDGKSLTATVPVTSLGVGTTTLYLMTGNNWNSENTVSASQVVTATGEQTLTATFPDSPWGTKVYYSLMLVNGTAESATTNWPNVNVAGSNVFYNKWSELQDNSTYTWIGGSAGVWNVPANWERTVAGSLAATQPAGYPVYASTAIFATAQGDGPITVTIPASRGTTRYSNENRWWVSTINLDGMHEELVFTSEDKTAANCRFSVYSIVAGQTYNRLTFDGCNVWLYRPENLGAATPDENGENFALTFTGRSVAWFDQLTPKSRPGFKVRIEDGASVTASGGIYGGTTAQPPAVIEIDDTSLTVNNKIEPDNGNAYNGAWVRLMGTNATLVASYFQPKNANSTNVVEFVIPVGGYKAVPVRLTHGTYVLGGDTAKAPMTFSVSTESPGLGSVSGKYGIQLVQSPGGVNAANVRFEDVRPNYCGFFFKDADGNAYADAAAIEAAGKTAAQITQIWYRPPPHATVLIVK